MSDQLIVERGGLEKKDKSELQAIVSALGGHSTSRAKKADLIDKIIELSGATASAPEPENSADETPIVADDATPDSAEHTEPEAPISEVPDRDGEVAATAEMEREPKPKPKPAEPRGQSTRRRGRRDGGHPVGPDGEPLADWEVEVMADAPGGQEAKPSRGNKRNEADRSRSDSERSDGNRTDSSRNEAGRSEASRSDANRSDANRSDANRAEGNRNDPNRTDPNRTDPNRTDPNRTDPNKADGNRAEGGRNDGNRTDGDLDPNNRRSRRRGRGRGRDRDDAGNEPISTEPVPVSGSLDLREEGYGFLRVDGHLPSKDDVYVSVKQVRQYGLRKGDDLAGLARPANRNEKNPGFHQIDSVNGLSPDDARNRPRFDDLTPLFPDERLVMEMRDEPLNMTSRIIDLVAPIGKGQRGLIVSPPKAGKTTVMKDIARAIETNNPEVRLIVLLIDERPEEVTDMRRHLRNGEVAASTFDRPPEEHCAVAELTIERAKRFVESGEDVCIIVDGITRLSRAYNLTAPQTGRVMSGGLDAGALYPPKHFFGAARNLEEGGSLTILATALVDTGSRMDEVIFEEFKGTGNLELRLDRRLAEKRIFPAIDVDGSSTRHEELLFDKKELQLAWKLRRVLSAMSEDGNSAAGIEMLVDRLAAFKTNTDFLAEMAKNPSV